MRIAMLSTFYPFRGGIAQFNGALYNELSQSHEVKAFNFTIQYPSLLFPGKTQFVDKEDGAYKVPTIRCLNSVNPASYRKTVRLISEFEPDLLIIGNWMPFMAPSLGFVAQKMRIKTKVIAIVHNAIPHERSKMDKMLNDYFFSRVDKIISLSESVKKDIHYHYPNKEVKVLHHPVYEHFGELINKKEARFKLGLDLDKKYLLFFGIIRAYKGLDIAIKSLANLPKEYHLIIAGESYEPFDKYETLIKKLELSSRVKIIDTYIPDEEVKFYFSAADACILPYKSATQSGIIAIAQHFKTPVFASDVGGLGEFVKNRETGFLLESENHKAFANAISSFFNSEEKDQFLNRLEENQEKLTWDYFANEVIAFGM